jgi:hypothetical protein
MRIPVFELEKLLGGLVCVYHYNGSLKVLSGLKEKFTEAIGYFPILFWEEDNEQSPTMMFDFMSEEDVMLLVLALR